MAQSTVETSDRTAADSSDAAASGAPPVSGQRTCPLCEFSADGENAIYVHLQTSHRKSSLSKFVTSQL